jgi:hypothetical protein
MESNDVILTDELVNNYKKALNQISDGLEDFQFLDSLPSFPKEFFSTQLIFPELGLAVDKVNHTYIKNGWAVPSPNYEGGSYSKVFCHNLARIFVKDSFSREEFMYLIENSSCGLMAYILNNPFLPVNLLLETEIDDRFKEDPYFYNLKWLREEGAYYRRREEILAYLREKLSNSSIESYEFTDKMVFKISGYNSNWM